MIIIKKKEIKSVNFVYVKKGSRKSYLKYLIN